MFFGYILLAFFLALAFVGHKIQQKEEMEKLKLKQQQEMELQALVEQREKELQEKKERGEKFLNLSTEEQFDTLQPYIMDAAASYPLEEAGATMKFIVHSVRRDMSQKKKALIEESVIRQAIVSFVCAGILERQGHYYYRTYSHAKYSEVKALAKQRADQKKIPKVFFGYIRC